MKKILILGPGCSRCEKLAENTEQAARELGLACDIQKVKDIDEIVRLGVAMTPAVVVDGEVKVAGKVPSAEELKRILEGGS